MNGPDFQYDGLTAFAPITNVATDKKKGLMSAADKAKLDAIPEGGGGALSHLTEVTLAADTATITFSSIPQTARHLRLVVYGRSTNASLSDALLVRFNGDSTGSYDRQRLEANAGVVAASELFSQTSIALNYLPGATATAGCASHVSIEIPDYARSNWQKAVTATIAEKAGSTSGFMIMGLYAGFWRSGAAITSITLSCGANLAAGTVATLYGLT